mgnify:FL=1
MSAPFDIEDLDDLENLESLQTIRLKIDVAKSSAEKVLFRAYTKDDDSYVGAAEVKMQAKPYGRVGAVAYEIVNEQRGRGYATELLRALLAYSYNDLGLVGIYGVAEEANLAAQYVLQRTGFVFNDTLVDGAMRFEAWNPRFQTGA